MSLLGTSSRLHLTLSAILFGLDKFIEEILEISNRTQFVETSQLFLLISFDLRGPFVDSIPHDAVRIEEI